MFRLPGRLLAVIVPVVVVLALLTGCTRTAEPPGSASPSSAANSPGGSARPSTATDAVTIDITIKDKKVTPNGSKINISQGQTVVLKVTSDADDEIHAHTSGDGYELEVKAGQPATGQFVAANTGTFEIEPHHLEKIIAILVVR